MPGLLVLQLEPPIFLLWLDLNDKKPQTGKAGLSEAIVLNVVAQMCTQIFPHFWLHAHRSSKAFLGALIVWTLSTPHC